MTIPIPTGGRGRLCPRYTDILNQVLKATGVPKLFLHVLCQLHENKNVPSESTQEPFINDTSDLMYNPNTASPILVFSKKTLWEGKESNNHCKRTEIFILKSNQK